MHARMYARMRNGVTASNGTNQQMHSVMVKRKPFGVSCQKFSPEHRLKRQHCMVLQLLSNLNV